MNAYKYVELDFYSLKFENETMQTWNFLCCIRNSNFEFNWIQHLSDIQMIAIFNGFQGFFWKFLF